jgi:hypothetical protein
MPRARTRPSEVIVSYRGVRYVLDLLRCRKALVRCQMEGRFDTTEQLGELIKASRSTISRFFAGRPTSLVVTRKIVLALGLQLDDVMRLADAEDEAGGGAVVAA